MILTTIEITEFERGNEMNSHQAGLLEYAVEAGKEEGEDIDEAIYFAAKYVMNRYAPRAEEALNLIQRYGGIDGDHHKAWVIDQVVRALTGKQYEAWVREACDGEDGPDTYSWDEGIAP